MNGFDKKYSRGDVHIQARFYDNISTNQNMRFEFPLSFLVDSTYPQKHKGQAHVCLIS